MQAASIALRAVLPLRESPVAGNPHSQRTTPKTCSTVRRCFSKVRTVLAMEHAVRKPVQSRRAYRQRKNTIALVMILALMLAAAMEVLLVG